MNKKLAGESELATGKIELSRRAVLRCAAALVAGGLSANWITTARAELTLIEMDEFLAAASVLCGLDAYDPGKGKPYWDHFKVDATLPALTKLVELMETTPPDKIDPQLAAAHLDQLAKSIVAAFYSGQIVQGNETQFVTYWDALVWQAVKSFTKPPGICGGSFGYWADPPKL
ncbi:MAG: sugar dehydrogenase complex small subunit [Candidatus Binatia bacterium]